LTSRHCLRDEEEPSKHHVQPCLDIDPRELLLTSLQQDARILIIVLKVEAMVIGGPPIDV
jgi:hypothetical protein